MTDPLITLLYSPTDLKSKRLYSQLQQYDLLEESPSTVFQTSSHKIIPINVSPQILKQKISASDSELNIPCIIISDPQTDKRIFYTEARLFSWVKKVIDKKLDYMRKQGIQPPVPVNEDEVLSYAPDPPVRSTPTPSYQPNRTYSSPAPAPAYQPNRNYSAPAPTTSIPTSSVSRPPPAPRSLPTTLTPAPYSRPPPPSPVQARPPTNGSPEDMRQESIRRQKEMQDAINERRRVERENSKPLSANEIMAKYRTMADGDKK